MHTQGEWLVDNYAVISEIPEGADQPQLRLPSEGGQP